MSLHKSAAFAESNVTSSVPAAESEPGHSTWKGLRQRQDLLLQHYVRNLHGRFDWAFLRLRRARRACASWINIAPGRFRACRYGTFRLRHADQEHTDSDNRQAEK